MVPWGAYEAFLNVVMHRSFTEAARALGVSKSVVSRYVRDLEDRLGTQLVLRTTRSLQPTQAGVELYEQCLDVFRRMQSIEHEVLDHRGIPQGKLRIAALDYFGEHFVAPIAAEMAESNPGLKVELSISPLCPDLVNATIDVSIQYGTLPDSSFKTVKLTDLHHCVAASPKYLRERGLPTHPDQLKDHACLVSTFDACSSWRFLIHGQEAAYCLGSSWRSNNGPAMIAAAKLGLGLTRLPTLYLQDEFKRGELVPILTEFPSPPMPVWAVFPYHRRQSASLRVFLDLLRTRLREVSRAVPVVAATRVEMGAELSGEVH